MLASSSVSNETAMGSGISKCRSTKARRSKSGVSCCTLYRATMLSGAMSGRASTNVFESGKRPLSWTSAKSAPRSSAGW